MAVSCTKCGRWFAHHEALQQHIKDSPAHTRNDPYCRDCNRWFVDNAAKEQHYQNSGAHRDYPSEESSMDEEESLEEQKKAHCIPCDRWFVDDEALEQHLQFNSAHKLYCSRCSQCFSNQGAKDLHMANSKSHNICFNAQCRSHYRNKADFETPDLLSRHLTKKPRHRFCCIKCKIDFGSETERLAHYTTIGSAHLFCKSCRRDFQSVGELKAHWETNIIHHYCEICNRSFNSATEYTQHLMVDQNHFFCMKCNMSFASNYSRDRHWLAGRSSHYVCQKCKRDFLTRPDLLNHWTAVDHSFYAKCELDFSSDDERRKHWEVDLSHHFCAGSNTDFLSQQILHEHQERESDKNYYICTLYGVSSDSDTKILQHCQSTASHHQCGGCEQDLWSDTTLVEHHQKITEHNKYGSCVSDFTTPKELYQQQSTHASRIQACVCNARFATLSSMMIHWESGSCVIDKLELDRIILNFPESDRFLVSQLKDHLRGTHNRIRSAMSSHYSRLSNSFVCPFDRCIESFASFALLDEHLASPWHDVAVFRCPNDACDVRSPLLSELLQHVEDSDCDEVHSDGLVKFLLQKIGLGAEAPMEDFASESLL